MTTNLELDLPELDFGTVAAGCEVSDTITIRSVGTGPLVLDSIVFSPTSAEMEFSYHHNLGQALAPGESVDVVISYEPVDAYPDTAELTVTSNDPAAPSVVAGVSGDGELEPLATEAFWQEPADETDILWVVDNTGSMADEQAAYAAEVDAYFDILDVLAVDYHLGVITTDGAPLVGTIPIMTPTSPGVRDAFADALQVGTGGAFFPTPLQQASEAVTPPLAAPGGVNDGFLREDAGLRVIVLTDDDDLSPDTVAAYVTLVQSVKIDPGYVTVNAIAGQAGGCAGIDPAPRLEDAIALTGGVSNSLCDPVVDNLADMGWLSLSPHTVFELAQTPLEASIEVDLQGVPMWIGWAFDANLNAVVFEEAYAPDFGDQVTVRYTPLAEC